MKRDLSDFRKSYKKAHLNECDVSSDPLVQFSHWFKEAETSFVEEPNAMVLTTMGKDDFPQSRIVLLKQLDPEGFVFFSQYTSQKGESIALNPRVTLLFFWPELERQVRIEGIARPVTEDESDLYFSQRPYASQIAAWASVQSQEISDRKVLEERVSTFQKKFKEDEVSRPPYLGGYLVCPVRMEFWQGRLHRLHDRILYTRESDHWRRFRLAP